ncbi:hypothetical protein PYW08_000906 [Mythimna loreyi]|uniref:Uncharacterized protein n=1 Tax=Mythimna loreyi TaxID=667449 RepID=A0ACC2QZV8_9NEOP|nr:hypothetical protein PYW08_000906 [Mythimna loreyi]
MAFNFRANIDPDLCPELDSCVKFITTVLSWVSQSRVISIIFFFLSIHACWVYRYHCSLNNYQHIAAQHVEAHLYKQRSSKLVLHKSKPDCNYDEILKSNYSQPVWEATRNFSANGLVNGSYAPEHCNALFSVAIIVPFKNRHRHLDIFLPHIHNFLMKQNIHYRLYIVEQQDEKIFNKGILFNVGVKTAMGHKFPCIILHDVDLLPLDASNLYVCTNDPRHMSASIDKFRFTLPYEKLMGGVVALKAEQYVAINGYSNRFQGWGGEDDDFFHRLDPQSLNLIRFPAEMSHYKALIHPREVINVNRFDIMRDNFDYGFEMDGLSTLPHVSARISYHPLFTLVGLNN